MEGELGKLFVPHVLDLTSSIKIINHIKYDSLSFILAVDLGSVTSQS